MLLDDSIGITSAAEFTLKIEKVFGVIGWVIDQFSEADSENQLICCVGFIFGEFLVVQVIEKVVAKSTLDVEVCFQDCWSRIFIRGCNHKFLLSVLSYGVHIVIVRVG
jgi:hypothetical protein